MHIYMGQVRTLRDFTTHHTCFCPLPVHAIHSLGVQGAVYPSPRRFGRWSFSTWQLLGSYHVCPQKTSGWWYTYPTEKHQSIGMIHNIWKNKKCSKPPTSHHVSWGNPHVSCLNQHSPRLNLPSFEEKPSIFDPGHLELPQRHQSTTVPQSHHPMRRGTSSEDFRESHRKI